MTRREITIQFWMEWLGMTQEEAEAALAKYEAACPALFLLDAEVPENEVEQYMADLRELAPKAVARGEIHPAHPAYKLIQRQN